MTKICSKCFCERPLSKFSIDKRRCPPRNIYNQCKSCIQQRSTEWAKKYPEKRREITRRFQEKWPERVRTSKQKTRSNPQHKKQVAEYDRRRRLENPELFRERDKRRNRQQLNAYYRNRRRKDPAFRILHATRSRIRVVLKGLVKKARTLSLLGCDAVTARKHLEKQFKPGMFWENYGEWEIDHIRPCASFDLTDIEQQKQCFHYTNLQPLWKNENRTKGDKWLMEG